MVMEVFVLLHLSNEKPFKLFDGQVVDCYLRKRIFIVIYLFEEISF